MWYPLCVKKPPTIIPKPHPPVKLPKPTHPSPKPPKQYNDYAKPLNLKHLKWSYKPHGF